MSENIRSSAASLFWSSDTPLREVESYEAEPVEIRYICGRCKVWINHDFDKDGFCYCMNHHLNRRPESAKIVWSGQI